MRSKHNWQKSVAVLLITALSLILFTACGSTNPEETEGSGPGTLPPVQVEMPAFTLTYSGELRDVIVLKELEGEDALEFNVKLSQVQAHIFTLQYNSTNGEFVTVLEDKAGEKIPVAFQMAELPEDLTEEDKNLFLTAQEAVNEIAASLVVKE